MYQAALLHIFFCNWNEIQGKPPLQAQVLKIRYNHSQASNVKTLPGLNAQGFTMLNIQTVSLLLPSSKSFAIVRIPFCPFRSEVSKRKKKSRKREGSRHRSSHTSNAKIYFFWKMQNGVS